jgi:transposase-like protein
MAKRASSERTRFWQDLIRRQPTSGLNIARFCEQAGVSQNSFFAWRRRLRTSAGSECDSSRRRRPPASTPKQPRPKDVVTGGRSLVPVRLVADLANDHASPREIEIAWPGGVVLRVPSGCNLDTLRDVFRLLTSAMNGEVPSC